jgi:hypothetical protein
MMSAAWKLFSTSGCRRDTALLRKKGDVLGKYRVGESFWIFLIASVRSLRLDDLMLLSEEEFSRERSLSREVGDSAGEGLCSSLVVFAVEKSFNVSHSLQKVNEKRKKKSFVRRNVKLSKMP